MDIPTLATETVKYLAPALPFLIKGGEEAFGELGKKFADGAVQAGSNIWEKLKPHAEKQHALLDAAHDVAANPDDADLQAVLRVQVRKLLEAQPQFAQ